VKRPDGTHVMRVSTPDEYAERAAVVLERDGFFEREIGRRTEQFGGVLHAFSAYESKRTARTVYPSRAGSTAFS
jgi:hypothetical protein